MSRSVSRGIGSRHVCTAPVGLRSGRGDLATVVAHRRPFLVLNPASDAAFVALARLLASDGTADASMLQERLRDMYPDAVVRRRDLEGEGGHVWYVYRDGSWRDT
jgi:hypothetical protein